MTPALERELSLERLASALHGVAELAAPDFDLQARQRGHLSALLELLAEQVAILSRTR